MDIHQNARLTLRSREALVETVTGGLGFSRAAVSFRVTPKTAAKWVRRYQQEGTAGLRDRSSRPHRSPRATSSFDAATSDAGISRRVWEVVLRSACHSLHIGDHGGTAGTVHRPGSRCQCASAAASVRQLEDMDANRTGALVDGTAQWPRHVLCVVPRAFPVTAAKRGKDSEG